MVIAEACAAARPVIYFDRPPMNEVASGSGCIAVPAFDVEALTSAMELLRDASDDEIASRGAACRTSVLDYRWDSLAAKQEAFYQDVAERSRRASSRAP